MSAYNVGSKPPFTVTHIDPAIGVGRTHQWFVMGTVDGDPRDQQGPVAICEYEPSAHAIAALLNATVPAGEWVVNVPRPGLLRRLWKRVTSPTSSEAAS